MATIWSDAARADLARIFAFNESRNEKHAERVDARLVERGNALDHQPRMGRTVGSNLLRILSVVDIQYVILYAILDGDVRIIRIYHTRENRETP